MEQHGNNPRKNVIAIIPARYESTRLPGKLLLPLAGRPVIAHTVERASTAQNVSRVIVAADDTRIIEGLRESGAEAVMTASTHLSGSDRIAEVAQGLPKGTIIVNVQGDEPLISPETIETAAAAYIARDFDVVTTSEPIIRVEDVLDPNVVKVVTDESGRALYFSRSPIPFPREAVLRHGTLEKALRSEPELLLHFRKHTGLYVYSREFLLDFTRNKTGFLENCEMLEQLRVLGTGIGKILVVPATDCSIGVDTADDYERVSELMRLKKPADSLVSS